MKTFLYGTTAMMAAAAVAGTASAQTAAKKPNEKITLQLGGYYHASYIIGDESKGQRACPIATISGGCADPNGGLAAAFGNNPTIGFASVVPFGGNVNEPGRGKRFQRLQHEAEVYFRGQTTLDNGLTIGAFIQLEAATQNDIIDETYIYFSGSFGRVEYGSMDSVAEQMYYGAPPAIEQNSTIVRNTGMPTFSTGANAAAYPAVGPYLTGYSDNDKVNYYTPRIAGFQFGISYQPEVCEDFGTDVIGGVGSGGGVGGPSAVTPGAAAAAGSGGCPAGFTPAANPGQQGDLMALSLNYVNKFGPVDVGVAYWYQKANLEGTTGFGSQNGIFATDRKAQGFGLNVSAYGFTLGGGWARENLGVRSNNTDRTDWNIGLRYRTGPWQLGIEYGHGERGAGLNPAGAAGAALPGGALGRAGTDDVEVFMAAVDYTMGPGVRFYGGIQYFNLDDNFGNPANENDGVLFIFGTRLDF